MDSIKFKRYSLGLFPTSIVRLERLSKLLNGPKLLMKRDDQTGLAFGGNKTRKLEYLIAQAIELGCDTIITGGAEQSNHCRQTAAACSVSGLECHLVLGGEKPAIPEGNLLLDYLFKANIHWSGDLRKGERIPEIVEQLKSKGKKPFIVPYGASNEIGALGFVSAVYELDSQLKQMNENVNYIVLPSSSGGTQAGLMLGLYLLNSNTKIIGIAIDKFGVDKNSFNEFVMNLANKTSKLLDVNKEFNLSDVELRDEYLGKGYGIVGKAERDTIQFVAEIEGILLDPVYTGRAMAGLIDLIKAGRFSPDDTVLFWHTGGTPALFSYANELV